MPSVDVVVPCYQYGRFLRDCVGSILAQDVENIRVLVIDNASTDGGGEVAQELAREDPRLEVIAHKVNQGASASYNEGIDWASADYFLLLDADDVLAPGCLARAITCMEDNPNVGMTYGGEERLVFGAHSIPAIASGADCADWQIATGQDFIRDMCRTAVNHVGATTVVRRTRVQKKAGYYRPEIPYSDDLEMWLRLAMFGDVAQTNAVQAIRRLHRDQATNFYEDFPVRDIVEREAAFKSFFVHEGVGLTEADDLRQQAVRRLSDQAYWSGLSHVFRAHPSIGWALLKYAISKRPLSVVLPPISHLFMMDRPLTRLIEVVSETATGRQAERMERFPESKGVGRRE